MGTKFLLSDLFDGVALENMKILISDDGDLERLKLFVLNNDGVFKSEVDLSFYYRLLVFNEKVISKIKFVSMYDIDLNFTVKKELCERLFLTMVNKVLVNKVDNLLKNGLTKENLYDSILKYRRYNPLQAIKLIEIHNRELTS